MSDLPGTFTIVGAGLAGSLMACQLGQAGCPVDLIDRRPDPRSEGADRGRSINLAISTRGLRALAAVGLGGAVLERAIPMRGRMMHATSGRTTFQPYGTKQHHVINSVSRSGLNEMLIAEADRLPDVRVQFARRVIDVELEDGTLVLDSADGSMDRVVMGQVIIGADGAFSAVRNRLQRLDRFDYSQEYLDYGYKELTIPPTADDGFRLEPNALHIWPRGGFMMIALPNLDGSFTCTLFWPFSGPYGLESLTTADAVRGFFGLHFPDVIPLMPTLVEDYTDNPNSSLVTIRCGPWYFRDRIVLIGDACHAVVPFYGQGANAAFEDCLVLESCLRRHAPAWESAFREYYELRKPHADVLADLAIDNFVEMRDKVGSTFFLLTKRAEKVLQRAGAFGFIPLYTLVTFSNLPYGDAVARTRRQTIIVWCFVVLVVVAAAAVGGWLWT